MALVQNAFTHDSRVRNEASALGAAGWDVVVVATAEKGLEDHETGPGFRVLRVGALPPDVRLWRNRDRIARPYRHRREFAGWLRGRTQAGGPGLVEAVLAAAGAVLVLPWVALMWVYHRAIRVVDRAAGGGVKPSRRIGKWTEDRFLRTVLVAHRPLRVRDWGQRIEEAVAAGELPVADVWHAHDLDTLPVARGLASRFGGRIVYDSHEVFLDAAGRARMAGWRRWLLRTAEKRWVRGVAAVVTVNDAVAAELASRYRIPAPVVVRNCAPRWHRPDGFRSPLADALAGVVDDPALPAVIAHGTFQRGRGFEELLAAAEPLPGLNVVFLGYGAQEEAYRAIAGAAPWRGRLAVLPAVPPTELVRWVAGAAVAACLIQPTTLNHRLSTPNKLFEAIAAGIPVLAADLPAIASIVRTSGAGILVDPTDVDAIRAGIAQLVGDPALRERLAAAARDAAERELSWERESQRLVGLYDRLVPAGAPGAGTAA